MTYNEFCEWFKSLDKPSDLREGQHAFCCLREQNLVLAKQIIATDADPFYDDNKLQKFWKILKESW